MVASANIKKALHKSSHPSFLRKIKSIDWKPYEDSLGRESIQVFVTLDSAADADLSQWVPPIEEHYRNRLRDIGLESFPLFWFRTPDEVKEIAQMKHEGHGDE